MWTVCWGNALLGLDYGQIETGFLESKPLLGEWWLLGVYNSTTEAVEAKRSFTAGIDIASFVHF